MHLTDPLTLANWQQAYARGDSPRDLLRRWHNRLTERPAAPAWIHRVTVAELGAQIDALEARAAAQADRAVLLRALPLFGVPFAVKDNIDVAGVKTTAACPSFARTAVAHAHAVARLVAAGAVWAGKTNLDQFATGLVGARSPYGRPSSTFDDTRVSGGSSSGSAVVVSAGEVPFALGTDTAGSGRVPAGFNNVVGLKPTPGRIGTSGVLPACRSLDCVSVFALTVDDAAQVLALIEGPDEQDAYSDFRPGPARWPARQLRLGIPLRPVFTGDAGYATAFAAAVAHAESLGHRIVPMDFEPMHAVAALLYEGPWVAERHAVVQTLLDRDPQAFDPAVQRVVEAARGFTATDAFRGLYRLREAQHGVAKALWRDVDALMVPTAPGHPRHAEVDADPIGANAVLGTYTNFVNLLGWCALALPAGFADGGLPFGVTFIAQGGHDAALARFGRMWECSLGLPLGATDRRAGQGTGINRQADAGTTVTATAGAGTAAGSGPDAGTRAGMETQASSPALPPAPWPATAPVLPIAVVGAHLSGLPLNGQLTERGAVLREATATAPRYRFYALPGTVPPKPGLQRVAEGDAGGAAIAVEVWDVPMDAVGSFLALVPPPLGLGSIELVDGRHVHGFLCEAHALAGARDITAFGGWRAYLRSLQPATGGHGGGAMTTKTPVTATTAAMTLSQIEAYVDAAAAAVGLTLDARHGSGVIAYLGLAATMAAQLDAMPLGVADEPAGPTFVPIAPGDLAADATLDRLPADAPSDDPSVPGRPEDRP